MNLASTTAIPENVTHGSTTTFYVNTTDLINNTTAIVTDYMTGNGTGATIAYFNNFTEFNSTHFEGNTTVTTNSSPLSMMTTVQTMVPTTVLTIVTTMTVPARDLKIFSIQLRITSLAWQGDYMNNVSGAYSELKENITSWLNGSFTNLTSYEGSEIISFSQGSVVANIQSRFYDPGVTEQQVLDALRGARDFPFWIVDKTNLTVQEFEQFTSVSSTIHTTPTILSDTTTHVTTEGSTGTQSVTTTSTMISHENSTDMTSSVGNVNFTHVPTTPPHNVTFDTSLSHENVTTSMNL
ncbi:unnamed protein product, partial [Lymnaea stagnalis]